MADQLQRAACEPPGNRGHGAGVRPGADPAGRGAAVPAAQQPKTPHYQPEGDQSQAANVTGTRVICALRSKQLLRLRRSGKYCGTTVACHRQC